MTNGRCHPMCQSWPATLSAAYRRHSAVGARGFVFKVRGNLIFRPQAHRAAVWFAADSDRSNENDNTYSRTFLFYFDCNCLNISTKVMLYRFLINIQNNKRIKSAFTLHTIIIYIIIVCISVWFSNDCRHVI